ncbi:hypothetical protein [Trichocoleus sp. FACHB-90]|uniref:hypothetical protein n=1 Tax=Trichocoleus sp. FACHB-90 TaxID=2692876 RepID=UPI001A7ED3DC|nr:hypothetical protein [Trichocoleus sp. FACHB-90]
MRKIANTSGNSNPNQNKNFPESVLRDRKTYDCFQFNRQLSCRDLVGNIKNHSCLEN